MSHPPSLPTTLWCTLSRIDRQSATEIRLGGCPHCGGTLHVADYPRKPRGVARAVLGEDYTRRQSFCCALCRRRTTPPSLRFLGRKVYLGALLVLFGNVAAGAVPTRRLFRLVAASCAVPARTLERWRAWWTETLPRTRWWRELGGRLVPPIDIGCLPTALLERLAGADLAARVTGVLALARPLSTGSCSRLPRVGIGTHEMC